MPHACSKTDYLTPVEDGAPTPESDDESGDEAVRGEGGGARREGGGVRRGCVVMI